MLRISAREALRLLYRNGFALINVRGGSHAKLRNLDWNGQQRLVVITGYNHLGDTKNYKGETEALLRECLAKEK